MDIKKQYIEKLIPLMIKIKGWWLKQTNQGAKEKARKRKERHSKVFQTIHEGAAHEAYRKTAHIFIGRVSLLTVLGILFFSIVPQFTKGHLGQYQDWSPGIEFDPRSSQLIDENGFLIKPEMWTELGDRSDVSGIIAYEVEVGDTISEIAAKLGVRQNTIYQNNNWLEPKKLKAGMVLKIPVTDGLVHVVADGETLTSIAKKYNVTLERMLTQNELEQGAKIAKNDELIIPGARKQRPKPPPPKIIPWRNSTPTAVSPTNTAWATNSYGKLQFPTNGTITQRYHPGHYAYDIANRSKPNIWAAEQGTVVRASYGWNGGYGNYIIVDHANGMQTLYAHNEVLYVSVGENVRRGQPIAKMGATGRVYGPTGIHLHFEVRVNGQKLNPGNFF